MPSDKHFLNSYVTAAWISLGAAFSPQILQAQDAVGSSVRDTLMSFQSEKIASGMSVCFPEIDISKYLVPYTVVSGDTLGKIGEEYGFDFRDLIAVWSEIYPGRDPSGLKIGETILILSPGYEADFQEIQAQLIAKEAYQKLISEWEKGNMEYIKSNYGFSITPDRPISKGLDHTSNVLGDIWKRNIRANAPANVDDRFIYDAVCAHQARRWDKVSFNVNDPSLPLELRQLISAYNIDAWMFSDKYIETGLFTIPERFDWRGDFSQKFSKGVHPIQKEKREEYMLELGDLLDYFSKNGKKGTKIPTKFLYTNAQPSISSYRGGINQASHIITFIGNEISDPFIAGEYQTKIPVSGFEFGSDGIELLDFLSYIVQDQADMFMTLSPSYHSQIKERLKIFAPHIEFWLNGEKINVAEVIVGGKIYIKADDVIRLGGALGMDGFHLYTSPIEQESSEMTTRLRLLWVYFASGLMFPANIIEPTQEMENLKFSGKYGDILNQIQVNDYISLRPGQDAKDVIQEYLAQALFGKSLVELSPEEIQSIAEQYKLQSYGHQLYGNQNFGGTEWKNGTWATKNTFAEESVTFVFRPIEIFDTSNLESLYQEYISKRKLEYYSLLKIQGCRDMNMPFYQVIFFPGDTLNTAIEQIAIQMEFEDAALAYAIKRLNPVKRALFLNALFGSRIVGGNIQAGEQYFIGVEEIKNAYRQISLPSFISDFELLREDESISPHSAILEKMIPDSDILMLMKYILANESYVNKKENGDIVGSVVGYDLASRRGIKDYLHYGKVSGLSAILNEYVLPIFTSQKVPETSSQGDFQMRFPNLYGQDYKKSWPGKHLEETLFLVLSPQSIFSQEIQEYSNKYPESVSQDRALAQEILQIYQEDIDQKRGREIAILLNQLMVLDDGNMSNIVGFIISASLAQEKLEEHVTNIAQQLTYLGIDITQLSLGEYERLIRLATVTFNSGEKKQLLAMSENYIIRILQALGDKYDMELKFPIVEKTGGIRNQVIYSEFVFFKHIPFYREAISELKNTPLTSQERQAIELIEASFEKIEAEIIDYQAHLYELLSKKDLQNLLKGLGKDSLVLPTMEEFSGKKSDLARVLLTYAEEGVLENRIQKPFISNQDRFFVYGIGAFLGLYLTLNTLAGLGNVAFKTMLVPSGILARGTAKITLRGLSEILSTGKKYIQRKIELRKEEKKLIFTNDNRFRRKASEYQDGVYSIGMEKKKPTIVKHDSNIIFTNSENDPRRNTYFDGNISITPENGIIQKPDISVLSPELRIDYEKFSVAAAE